MSRIKRFSVLILLLSCIMLSCGGDKHRFGQEFNKAMTEKKGDELLNALLELDQNYPGRLELKVNIGGMLLASGNWEQAGFYLAKGEEIAGRNKDKGLKALLFTNLAELSYRKGQFLKGLEYAERSLSLNPDDSLGVILTKAKCLLSLDKRGRALGIFNSIWEMNRELMNREDMKLYAALLVEQAQYSEAVTVIDEYQKNWGYELGLGIEQSVLFEKLGLINESILAAARELEYRRYHGMISSGQEIGRLEELEKRIEDRSWNLTGEGREVLKGLQFYVREEWEQAGRCLAGVELKHELADLGLFVLSSALERGKAGTETFKKYLELEPHFRDLPAYYRHLWRGMKKGRGLYNIGSARGVLEKCILLSPNTEYAVEARAELGRLTGLTPGQGEKILLGPELDKIYEQLLSGSEPSALDPVLELLSVPDNVYGLAAVLMLQQAQRMPGVSAYLSAREQDAEGRLKERLSAILKN
ncbi:hypothetical protein ES703_104894 [subsurface metagenome]